MKLSKVGSSNSTIISTSLLSFSSPRAKEPNRPILLTPNLFFISCSCRLKISIIFIIASCKYWQARIKNLPLSTSENLWSAYFPREYCARAVSGVLELSSKTLCLRDRPPPCSGPHSSALVRTGACGWAMGRGLQEDPEFLLSSSSYLPRGSRGYGHRGLEVHGDQRT